MELNREQIIKALEHCINRKDCSDCVIKSKEFRSGCIGRPRAFFKNALSLIKELTDENERLKTRNVDLEQKLMILNAGDVPVVRLLEK